jgi:hypothetical protein
MNIRIGLLVSDRTSLKSLECDHAIIQGFSRVYIIHLKTMTREFLSTAVVRDASHILKYPLDDLHDLQ